MLSQRALTYRLRNRFCSPNVSFTNCQNTQQCKTRVRFEPKAHNIFRVETEVVYGVTNDFSKDKETEEMLKTTMVNLTT